MRKRQFFRGVEVVTYCLMSNHFHLLVRVPERESLPKLTVESLLGPLGVPYDDTQSLDVRREIERAQPSDDPKCMEQILARYESRRGDLSVFPKALKQRFAQWCTTGRTAAGARGGRIASRACWWRVPSRLG